MPRHLEPATRTDAAAVFALKQAVAEDLTRRFGKGHWSSFGTEKGAAREAATPGLWVARRRGRPIAMLRLAKKKPWAIDLSYFTPCKTPLYLTGMAVSPPLQGQGIGRACLTEARCIAEKHHAQAIRLDAYDADAGAGAFYAKCGFREVGRVIYRKNPLVYYEALI
jgi:GNAT superfamily N-acetyltransferase